MLFNFSMPVLIRHWWQLKTVIFPALVSLLLSRQQKQDKGGKDLQRQTH